MPLAPGTRLGCYEILAPIGAGGMGEVYRARDGRLNRDVAIKVLPDLLAGDSGQLARFRREAQVLASLNHPNIAHLYGFEDAGTTHALVMELVEGPTLADRIAAGPIALAAALPIARQIAEALEAAHGQGIVHRDLKPANVKVRDDGTVKVLDFGLAKALDPVATSDAAAALVNSPTITSPALTQRGVILGTAAYMSPEQAAGTAVDKRSDLWAFGVVLLEMLTGRPVFAGHSVAHVLAAVLKSEPDWTALPAETPAAVRRLLRRCLEKDRRRRMADASDAQLELDDAGSPADRDGGFATIPLTAAVVPAWRRALPWAVAVAGLGTALLLLFLWSPWRAAPAPIPRKLLASIGADASLPTLSGASAILSPDGTTFAFAALQAGQARIFVRKLDQLQAEAIAGTEGAESPFFSPDGQWIGFFAAGSVKKVPVTGGAAVILGSAGGGRGATWTADDTIIFSPNPTANQPLLRVSAAGGKEAVFGKLSEGAVIQQWPQALPGGKGVLYSENSSTTGFDTANLVVAPLAGGTPKIIVRGGYYGRYVPSGPASSQRSLPGGGHLIYMQQGTLFAVRFDLDRLETIGQAVPALEGLTANTSAGTAQLAFSSEGTLVYVPGTVTMAANPIDWMTRDGKTSVLRATKADWASPSFSPDGQKLALEIFDGRQRDIWVYEWARGDNPTQLTFDPGEDRFPVWTPDSRRIVFGSDRAKSGTSNLYWMNADGTGEVARLTDSPEDQRPFSWHRSGRFLAFQTQTKSWTLMILPMQGDAVRGWTPGTPTVFLSTPAVEHSPRFSPDGRWIAYFSNEAGSFNLYVRPFPGPGGQRRVSTEGGGDPRWSATAPELLFLSQGMVMFSAYTVTGDSFRASKPQIWSPTTYRDLGSNNSYDLHPDGRRIAILAARGQGTVIQDKVVFVFNFFDHLRKIAPGRN